MPLAATAPNAADSSPYAIESGVPVKSRPGRTGYTAAVQALANAKVGDSFFVPDRDMTGGVQGFRSNVASSCRYVGGAGWASARVVEGGIRVWKVAEPKLAKSSVRRVA